MTLINPCLFFPLIKIFVTLWNNVWEDKGRVLSKINMQMGLFEKFKVSKIIRRKGVEILLKPEWLFILSLQIPNVSPMFRGYRDHTSLFFVFCSMNIKWLRIANTNKFGNFFISIGFHWEENLLFILTIIYSFDKLTTICTRTRTHIHTHIMSQDLAWTHYK